MLNLVAIVTEAEAQWQLKVTYWGCWSLWQPCSYADIHSKPRRRLSLFKMPQSVISLSSPPNSSFYKQKHTERLAEYPVPCLWSIQWQRSSCDQQPRSDCACNELSSCVFFLLTQLVEMCLQAVWSWDWTHHACLLESAPLIHQTPLTTDVILQQNETRIKSDVLLINSRLTNHLILSEDVFFSSLLLSFLSVK